MVNIVIATAKQLMIRFKELTVRRGEVKPILLKEVTVPRLRHSPSKPSIRAYVFRHEATCVKRGIKLQLVLAYMQIRLRIHLENVHRLHTANYQNRTLQHSSGYRSSRV